MSQWLVSFDTDRIKEYVFATGKLREVRGASYLLDDLNKDLTWDEIKKVCSECERVYFAGGGGAVLAPSEEVANRIIIAVENLYQRIAHTASITGALVPLLPATKEEGFGARVELAGLRLRAKKDKKARPFLPGIQPYTQPCSSCELHPATRVSLLDRQPVCESCNTKREVERQRREKEDEDRKNNPLLLKQAEDLSDLGNISHPRNYIGFISADGNNLGSLLSEMESMNDYQKLSRGLNELIRNAIGDAFKQYPSRPGDRGFLQPYEELLVGGDDLMIVTAADIAFDAVIKMTEFFEQGSRKLLEEIGRSGEKPLTLGIGIVIAHAKFPMVAFNRLASQLQKKAKQRCADEKYKTSAIDFMVVNAAGSDDVETLRRETLTEKVFAFSHGDRHVNLTQRPYALAEMKELLAQVRAFKNETFPQSQLQFLYEGLFQSQVEAVYRWGRVAGRVKKEHRKLMDAFAASNLGSGTDGFSPWKENRFQRGKYAGETVFTSNLGDLVEIYPFIPSFYQDKEVVNGNTSPD